MVVMVLNVMETLFAMEHQEIHAEAVERSDEYTSHHSEISKVGRWQGTEVHCLDDAVF